MPSEPRVGLSRRHSSQPISGMTMILSSPAAWERLRTHGMSVSTSGHWPRRSAFLAPSMPFATTTRPWPWALASPTRSSARSWAMPGPPPPPIFTRTCGPAMPTKSPLPSTRPNDKHHRRSGAPGGIRTPNRPVRQGHSTGVRERPSVFKNTIGAQWDSMIGSPPASRAV